MVRRHFPLVPTILVAVAVAMMVWLGVWQLQRRTEKAALMALYAANETRPQTAFAALWPIGEGDLFRRVGATCLEVVGWTVAAGHSVDDRTGWSHIASCRTGAEGPGLMVDMGVSSLPQPPRGWSGGPIAGRLVWAPEGRPLIARLLLAAPPPTPLIVSTIAAPGLRPTAPPDPANVPNNHLAYAVQWFLFAIVAVVIYGLALRRRNGRSST